MSSTTNVYTPRTREQSNGNTNTNANNNKNEDVGLTLNWCFGLNGDLLGGVNNLEDISSEKLFFVAGHTGIIFNSDTRQQTFLQGHTNPISCVAVSEDRLWIVTADEGTDNMLVLWDAKKGVPARSIFRPHLNGTSAVALSHDSMFIATLSVGPNQELAIWDWTNERRKNASNGSIPLISALVPTMDQHAHISFNSTDSHQIITTGPERVVFWTWNPDVAIAERDNLEKDLKANGEKAEDDMSFTPLPVERANEILISQTPPLHSKDFRLQLGAFTQSIFIPNSNLAVSATFDGDILVWDLVTVKPSPTTLPSSFFAHSNNNNDTTNIDIDLDSNPERKALKALRLHNGRINVLSHTVDYLVTGGADGFVRFFDFQFRLVAWFENFDQGPITSISFSIKPSLKAFDTTTAFKAPEFIIGTKNSVIVKASPESWDENGSKKKGSVLAQYFDGPIYAISSHPSLPHLAILTYTGQVVVLDYNLTLPLTSRKFEKLFGFTICYSPNGDFLAVGFTNGTLKILDAHDPSLKEIGHTLENSSKHQASHHGSSFRHSRDCITEIVFSQDSQYIATSDMDKCVCLYKFSSDQKWTYIGKYRSHYHPITGLLFLKFPRNEDQGNNSHRYDLKHDAKFLPQNLPVRLPSSPPSYPRLISIGEDKQIIEYDVGNSSPIKGLQILSITLLSQSAIPTSIVQHPLNEKSNEDLIIIANNQYKFQMYNSYNKMCRKTVLSPTYAGPLTKMSIIEPSVGNYYMAYSTSHKVIGLIKLPIDGNPNRAVGLIAHPNMVSNLVTSYDGKYLFTAGGEDKTINMWIINTDVIDRISTQGGSGLTPFSNLIEGGTTGVLWDEMKEYFYYAQIRNQSENTTDPRIIGNTVHVEQISSIMRALGYYPTEREIEDMMNEIKYETYFEDGLKKEYFDIDTLIKTYVNHRPVFGVSQDNLQKAFELIGIGDDNSIDVSQLLSNLEERGEKMTKDEILQSMASLLSVKIDPIDGMRNKMFNKSQGKNYTSSHPFSLDEIFRQLGNRITPSEFAEKVLGFEPLQNVENDENYNDNN